MGERAAAAPARRACGNRRTMAAMNAATTTAAPGAHPLPPAALRLAYGGLAPFVVAALLVWFVRDDARPYVTLALASYAAVIASFLGGILWGLALRDADPPALLLGWGILLPAMAWIGVLMAPAAGLVVDGVLLAASYGADRRLYPAQGVGRWLTVRFRLSAVAALCCFLAAAGS